MKGESPVWRSCEFVLGAFTIKLDLVNLDFILLFAPKEDIANIAIRNNVKI